MKDDAVSELLGYAMLAGVVIIATIGISTGAGDLISSSVRSTELAEAAHSVSSFAHIADQSIATDNDYPEALEMVIPQEYDLVMLDKADDWRNLKIEAGGSELTSLRTGSISIRSTFRSATYEAGGVFVDDPDGGRLAQKPSVFVAGTQGGRMSLYITVPCLSTDTGLVPSDRHTMLALRCKSLQDYKWPLSPGTRVSVEIRTSSLDGWRQVLESQGFTVAMSDDTVRGTRGGIDDVYLTAAELHIGLAG